MVLLQCFLVLACIGALSAQVLTSTPSTITEGPNSVTVNVAGLSDGSYFFSINATSTAVKDVDFTLPSLIINVVGGAADLQITILTDSLTEGDETIVFDVRDAQSDPAGTLTLTIQDPEPPTPSPPPPSPVISGNGTNAFDCNRPGQSCSNDGNCTIDSNECQCPDGTEGVDCSINTAQINGTGCDALECVHGVCVSNGTASCACPPEFYGDTCAIPYVSVKCFPEYMIVFYNPIGSFSGRFGVEEMEDESACEAITIPDPSGDDIDDFYEGMFLKINYTDSPCGNFTPKEEGDITSREADLLLQHMPWIITGRDQKFLARCYFNRNNHVIQGEAFTVGDGVEDLEEELVQNEWQPIKLDVTADGDPVDTSNPSAVDTVICVTVSVPEDHGAVEINKVEFNSSNDGQPYEWVIYDEGCAHDGASAVHFESPYYTNPKYEAMFCFKMFYVRPSGRFSVWVTVSTCLDEAECNIATCGGRKKRQVEEKRKTEDYEIVFFVNDPEQETTNTKLAEKPSAPSSVKCDELTCQTYFVPMVCGLVVLCVVLLVLAAILLGIRRRRRSKEEDY